MASAIAHWRVSHLTRARPAPVIPQHLYKKHRFNLGRPENLVHVDQLLRTLEVGLGTAECPCAARGLLSTPPTSLVPVLYPFPADACARLPMPLLPQDVYR